MGKREIVGMKEAWWVWMGDEPAIRVETEAEARSLMLNHGREYGIRNSNNRCDMASPVVEVAWNDALPVGETCHKTVISPVVYVIHNGKLRKTIQPISPSELARITKEWSKQDHGLPAWLPRQYLAAMSDPETLIQRGKQPLEVQLNQRWPHH